MLKMDLRDKGRRLADPNGFSLHVWCS